MAASDAGLSLEQAREALRLRPRGDEPFRILQTAATLASSEGTRAQGRDLIIRALEQPDAFVSCQLLLNGLIRDHGLYPYLDDPQDLTTGDLIAFEAHRPVDYDRDVVFHRLQARVYRHLLAGRSVVLSAPTSFGKSLILDAVAASGRLRNIAVVVPTLALVDETRRRLARLGTQYKIVTHPAQQLADRNIIVMTQERLLELPDLPELDLYMIDEFYKLDLDPRRGETDRAALLNLALHRLRRSGAPFYLAGPNVQQLAEGLPEDFAASFIATSEGTVAVDVTLLPTPAKGEEAAALVDLCRTLDGPTLIYCSSPAKARGAAAALLEADLGVSDAHPTLRAAADWIGTEYHPEWLVGRALASGIGIHHGKLPRALGQFQVAAFNDRRLRYLVCTSTLIEGVNTVAKNVVVFNHQLNRRNIDYFTYANIQGRSGRMRQHFVGNVYLFRPEPKQALPTVDIPVYTQHEDVPESLLVQLDREELTDRSWERISPLHDQQTVPLETLRANNGIDPRAQIALVRDVRQRLGVLAPQLSWAGYPTYDQLVAACELIVEHLHPISGRVAGVASGSQLAFKVNLAASARGDFHEVLMNELVGRFGAAVGPDDAVESGLEFLRTWPGYRFPRLLLALNGLVNPLLIDGGWPAADYSVYASAALNLFLPAHVAALEEYGLPAQVAVKLLPRIGAYDDLDDLLDGIRRLQVPAELNAFERSTLVATQAGL